jgi:hypothetical protein
MRGQSAIPKLAPETPRHPATPAGITSLLIITLLCLPSLIGATTLRLQLFLHEDISQWNSVASALIAFGSWFGLPLVLVAAIVGAIITLTRVPLRIKNAELFIVTLASLATVFLLLRLAR